MATTGCLITDPPQFEPPKHTRPFLVNPSPDPAQVLKVDLAAGTSHYDFSAELISQDDPPDNSGTASKPNFQAVEGWLLIDYGFGDPSGGPWRHATRLDFKGRESGNLDQSEKRTVSASMFPGTDLGSAHGCHRATFIVSHILDSAYCPVCADDFSTITWLMHVCDMSNADCVDMPTTGAGSCDETQLPSSCSEWQRTHPPIACPSAADAGAGGGGT